MFDWLKRAAGTDVKVKSPGPALNARIPPAQTDRTTQQTVEAVIPLATEDVVIEKRKVEGDRVRVSIDTLTETRSIEEDLMVDAVEVERRPVDRVLTEIPEIREEEDVMIIPVIRERLVLKKELVLVEEVHIKRQRHQQTLQREIDIRRQEPRIERISSDDAVTTAGPSKTAS